MKKLFLVIFIVGFSFHGFSQGDDKPLDVRYNQYGVEVSRTKLTAEKRDGILVFESKDQNYRLWFDTRVQIDGAVFFGEKDYMNDIGNGVTNRRARFAIKAKISRDWYGEIDTDFANGDVELKDALVRYIGFKNWTLSLGNFKEDFSMEQTTSSRYLPFMERPMAVSAFAPSRHVGLEANYYKNWLYASGGVFFQSMGELESVTNVEDNNKDFGRNQGISLTGKLIFLPFHAQNNYGLHIGLGGSYRTPKTDVAPKEYGGARYSARNSTSINRKKYLDTDVILNVDNEFLYNIELAGFYRNWRFQSEFIGNNVYMKDYATDVRTKNLNGWYAMAGVLIFGGTQRYDTGDGEFTQPSRGRKWGDIELLARYDYLDLNSKSVWGGSGENFTFGVNYYINSSVKFVLNYQYSKNDRYANGKGKLFIGRDAAGVPTTNYTNVDAAKGKAGVRYQMLGMRMEIDF